MAQYVECPICEASCPLDEDAKQGDEIFCTYCNGPLILKKSPDGKFRAVEG